MDDTAAVTAEEVVEVAPGYEKFTTKANKDDNARILTMEYHIGETLEEASEKFGDEVVLNLFGAQLIVQVQAAIRRKMNNKDGDPVLDDGAIVEYIANEYKPGIRTARAGTTKIDTLVKAYGKMTAEKKAEFLALLTAPGE